MRIQTLFSLPTSTFLSCVAALRLTTIDDLGKVLGKEGRTFLMLPHNLQLHSQRSWTWCKVTISLPLAI